VPGRRSRHPCTPYLVRTECRGISASHPVSYKILECILSLRESFMSAAVESPRLVKYAQLGHRSSMIKRLLWGFSVSSDPGGDVIICPYGRYYALKRIKTYYHRPVAILCCLVNSTVYSALYLESKWTAFMNLEVRFSVVTSLCSFIIYKSIADIR
jgi:hypothetical protein